MEFKNGYSHYVRNFILIHKMVHFLKIGWFLTEIWLVVFFWRNGAKSVKNTTSHISVKNYPIFKKWTIFGISQKLFIHWLYPFLNSISHFKKYCQITIFFIIFSPDFDLQKRVYLSQKSSDFQKIDHFRNQKKILHLLMICVFKLHIPLQ